MGGSRPATAVPAEVFEPADPARTMPKWLVFGAVAAVILIVLVMSWLNKRSLDQPDANAAVAEAPAAAPQAAPRAPPTAPQSVTVAATEPVWLQINEKGGPILYSAMMVPGQSFTVPPTATAPVLKTGKPEALRITVGNSVAPAVGPPATTVSNVSLLPADLMRGGQAPAPQPATAAPNPAARPPATSRTRPRRSSASTVSVAPAPESSPTALPTNTTG